MFLLGVIVTLAEGGLSARGTTHKREKEVLRLKSMVICTGCSLAQAQVTQSDGHQLYQLIHGQDYLVLRVRRVNDALSRRYFVWPPVLQIQAQDRLLQILSASENRFKEVEITGLLEDAETLEITAVQPVG